MQFILYKRTNNVKVMATGHCRVLGCGESRSELTERHSDHSGLVKEAGPG